MDGGVCSDDEKKAFAAAAAAAGAKVGAPVVSGATRSSLPALAGAGAGAGALGEDSADSTSPVASGAAAADGAGAGAGAGAGDAFLGSVNASVRSQPRRRSVPTVLHPAVVATGGDIDFLPADLVKANRASGIPMLNVAADGGLFDPKSPTSLKSRLLTHRLGGAASGGEGGAAVSGAGPSAAGHALPPSPGASAAAAAAGAAAPDHTHAHINHSSNPLPRRMSPRAQPMAVSIQPSASTTPVPVPHSPSLSSPSAMSSTNSSPISASQSGAHHHFPPAHALNSGHAIVGTSPASAPAPAVATTPSDIKAQIGASAGLPKRKSICVDCRLGLGLCVWLGSDST